MSKHEWRSAFEFSFEKQNILILYLLLSNFHFTRWCFTLKVFCRFLCIRDFFNILVFSAFIVDPVLAISLLIKWSLNLYSFEDTVEFICPACFLIWRTLAAHWSIWRTFTWISSILRSFSVLLWVWPFLVPASFMSRCFFICCIFSKFMICLRVTRTVDFVEWKVVQSILMNWLLRWLICVDKLILWSR